MGGESFVTSALHSLFAGRRDRQRRHVVGHLGVTLAALHSTQERLCSLKEVSRRLHSLLLFLVDILIEAVEP